MKHLFANICVYLMNILILFDIFCSIFWLLQHFLYDNNAMYCIFYTLGLKVSPKH
jgi:hypothetical protein